MNEFKKNEYLKFLFLRAKSDMTVYELGSSQKELINNLFGRLSTSENLLKDLFILSQIKDLHNIGKYLIFIVKKIEDEVITFDNFTQNLNSDSEYVEKELLSYFSNPKVRIKAVFRNKEDVNSEISIHKPSETFKRSEYSENKDEYELTDNAETKSDIEDEEEILQFKKNYLELIQTGETDEEIVYELPKNSDEIKNIPEGVTDEESLETDNSEVISEQTEEEISGGITGAKGSAFELPEEVKVTKNFKEEISFRKDDDITGTELPDEMEGTFRIKKIIKSAEQDSDKKEVTFENTETSGDSHQKETLLSDNEERIKLSKDIQDELNLFTEEGEQESDEDSDNGEAYITEQEPEPTNTEFISFEQEIKKKNDELDKEFDIMIYLVNAKPGDEDERNSIIRNIIDLSEYLENISRKMSLEIISNIYQTVTLSFEKISDGKYDISESTLNLFKKGLLLIVSLIKGDDYYGYKDILKSIENIRNSLIEEKAKMEIYKQQQREKLEIEKQINQRFPDDLQKEKLTMIRQLILETEENFNSLERITGEYRIYEALRNLTGNLNNLKDMVKLSKELEMKKTVQISEASYIFIKFLQNYRIDPLTDDIRDIFRYIIFNMKSSVINRHVEDFEVFISYLNDPVKIFSKAGKKKP
ncbi:MAG: hypothetical protein IPP52_11025 [Ignavibacteria bacterium]|nr:hypothetical protein [Ignavibacteria bacterium]